MHLIYEKILNVCIFLHIKCVILSRTEVNYGKIVTREEQNVNPLDQLISLPDETADDARSAALGRAQADN